MKAEMSLAAGSRDSDVVVCLHSLPPLFKFPGNVIVFLQNRNLVEKYSLKKFTLSGCEDIDRAHTWVFSASQS